MLFALDAKRLHKIARAHGCALDHDRHVAPEVMRDPFYVWGQHLRITSWRRDRPIDAPVQTTLDAKMTTHLRPVDLVQMRACAMTGWCRCDLCAHARRKRKLAEPELTDIVPRAWALLAECCEVVGAASSDAEAAPILGDWLEERGARIPPQLLRGLATTYHWSLRDR